MQHSELKEKKICVSIAESQVQAAIDAAQNVAEQADVIEIRLDALTSPTITPFIDNISTSILFTNRPTWEGGNYSGEEDDRIQLLLEAVENGASYIDIELKTEKEFQQKLIAAAQKTDTQTIVSWHNFKETPDYPKLGDILQKMRESGADIGKIVTMAHDFNDVLRILHLQILAHKTSFPLIAFCMGKAGMISRLATLELGGFMTYAAPDNGEATAPGQLPLKNLLTAMEQLRYAD
jgi:3-dehydroquinate dehydratase I